MNYRPEGRFKIHKQITMSRLGNYLRDTKAELKHVSWPTQTQTIVYTVLVIVISAVTAAFFGAVDHVFTLMLDKLIHTF